MIPLFVFIGGGFGSLLRYGLCLVLPAEKFPIGVLVCNLLGCFLIGCVAGLFPKPSMLQIAVITGVLGGFTTFSSFSYASLKLLEQGHQGLLLVNILVSVVGGIGLSYLGFKVASFF